MVFAVFAMLGSATKSACVGVPEQRRGLGAQFRRLVEQRDVLDAAPVVERSQHLAAHRLLFGVLHDGEVVGILHRQDDFALGRLLVAGDEIGGQPVEIGHRELQARFVLAEVLVVARLELGEALSDVDEALAGVVGQLEAGAAEVPQGQLDEALLLGVVRGRGALLAR
jgi:hypothetical protein